MSSSLEQVASTVQRLAVLLGAGIPPSAAWSYLDADPVVAEVAGAEDIPRAIVAASSAPAWRIVAAAWTVATEVGAPLAPTLREFARSLRTLAAVERDITTALAGPRATARLVMVLPAVSLLLGMLLGFDTLRVLATTPPGWGCLIAGGALLATALVWNRRLIAAATPRDLTTGLRCELVAIAVSGGGAIAPAVASVDAVMARLALADDRSVDSVIALSGRAGVPAAELLRSEADEARRRSAANAQRAAEVLGVRLMLPLGVCILPAFIVLGVVPLVVSVLSSTALGF